MPHPYGEDRLVEQPAKVSFAESGGRTVSAMEEVFGANGTLARKTSSDAVVRGKRGEKWAGACSRQLPCSRSREYSAGQEPRDGKSRCVSIAQGGHQGV